MELELWLDESGDFYNDGDLTKNPSLVGGLLIPKGMFTREQVVEIIGKKNVHFKDELDSSLQLEVLKKMKAGGGELVIFQNKERLQIVDSDRTYLNILAEGIVQLFHHLAAIHPEFFLDILVATRKDTVRGKGIIEEQLYIKGLRERIIIRLAGLRIASKKTWDYRVAFGDARTDPYLMVADAVCNTQLTKTSSKFSRLQKDEIAQLYEGQPYFTLYENSQDIQMKNWLAAGRLNDVILACFGQSDIENASSYIGTALDRLALLPESERELQLLAVSSRVRSLVQNDKKYEVVQGLLERLQEEFLPLLDERQLTVPKFNLDITLYLYTVLTHQGSSRAAEQDERFLKEIAGINDALTRLEYFKIYKLRRTIHLKNMLDIRASLNDITDVIAALEDLVQLLDLVNTSLGGESSSNVLTDLGKAYGTRGQSYIMLIKEDIGAMDAAINDFDRALGHFSSDADRRRQHLYKSLAYSEGGKYQEALSELIAASGMQETTVDELAQNLAEREIGQSIFLYYSYFKLMATSKKAGEEKLADSLYEALKKSAIKVEQWIASYGSVHPLQFICWSFADYLLMNGKKKQGLNYMDAAIALCNVPLEQATFQVVRLGLYADKVMAAAAHNDSVAESRARDSFANLLASMLVEPNCMTVLGNLNMLEIDQQSDESLQSLVNLAKSIL